jgi:hypothetical protein
VAEPTLGRCGSSSCVHRPFISGRQSPVVRLDPREIAVALARTERHDDESRQLEAARRDLVAEFADRVPEAEVTARFDELVARYADAPVRGFVPVLVGRQVRSVLANQQQV